MRGVMDKKLKEAVRAVKQEMGITSTPAISSPMRMVFMHRVEEILSGKNAAQIGKLEDYSSDDKVIKL